MTSDERKGRRNPDPPGQSSARNTNIGKSARKANPATPEVGRALRSAYQQTVDETIPPEMLDLLGKLG